MTEASLYDLLNVYVVLNFFFFFNDTATTEIYTLSLHDALPIYWAEFAPLTGFFLSSPGAALRCVLRRPMLALWSLSPFRSEEHTSELQSQSNLVCRLLLEKKKNAPTRHVATTVSD